MMRRGPGIMQMMHSIRARGPVLLMVNDPGSRAPTLPTGRLRRAIVVDDDPTVRRAMSRRLRPELDLYVCASVREATEVLTKIDRIDLALVDLNLPDGSGEQVLRLVAQWPDAISVLMSGSFPAVRGEGEPQLESPLENRALAHLVLAKPIAPHVIDALKKAVLELAKD
jgi:CheY-like chemotaxis protein